MINKIVKNLYSFAVLLCSTNSFAEHGGVEFVGGKPVVIAFPATCENFAYTENDFSIKTTLFCDVNSGRVTKIWVKTAKGQAWADSKDEIDKILPHWQLPFLQSIIKSIEEWKFQKTKSIYVNAEVGDVLDQSIGQNFNFRFVKIGEGVIKIQISNDDGIVADDLPSIK